MRARLLQLVGLLVPLIVAACGDLPTSPRAAAESDPLASCYWRADGTAVCTPEQPSWECDPWESLDWCQGSGGTCMSSVGQGNQSVAGCPPGGGGGDDGNGPGGGTIPPPGEEQTDPDTCITGDETFDTPAVRAGLKDLWERSNPDAPQAQRLEQAGWIIQRPDGSYAMAPFSIAVQGPCRINGNFAAPQGAIAWVHTHPFTAGEAQTICGAMKQPDPLTGGWRDVMGPNGLPVYPVYSNRPSIPDYELLKDVNATMAMLGRSRLAGVVIDANQTTIFSDDPGEGTTPLPRCGY